MTNNELDTKTRTITLTDREGMEIFDAIASSRFKAEQELEEAESASDTAWVSDARDSFFLFDRLYDKLQAVFGHLYDTDDDGEYEEDDLTADEATEAHTTFYDGVCEQCSTGLVVAVPCRLQQPDEATDDALTLDEVEQAIQAIEARTPGDKATCGHCEAPLSKGTLTDLLDLGIFEGTNVRGLCDACGTKASNSPHRIF